MGKRHLISLFSQSGKEILDIARDRGELPDLIITNNHNPASIVEPLVEIVEFLPDRPTSEQYRELFKKFDNPIITLHGWLRIIPADICEEFEIFNGHPGLISSNYYPELKGFNAQERVVGQQEKYPYIGSVIHRVTSKLDEGEILTECVIENNTQTVEEAYSTLRDTSFSTWRNFFKYELYN